MARYEVKTAMSPIKEPSKIATLPTREARPEMASSVVKAPETPKIAAINTKYTTEEARRLQMITFLKSRSVAPFKISRASGRLANPPRANSQMP